MRLIPSWIYKAKVFLFLIVTLSTPAPAQNVVEGLLGNIFTAEEFVVEVMEDTRFRDADALKHFYFSREQRPYWHDLDGDLEDHAEDFIDLIGESWKHGLNPESYHFSALQKTYGRQELELLLSDAFLRYVQDLSGMRVSAKALDLRAKDWRQAMEMEDVWVLLQGDPTFKSLPERILPRSGTYKRLQDELVKLVNAVKHEGEFEKVDFFGQTLKRGDRHPNMQKLRARLRVKPQTADETYFDDRLAGAVMRFQRKHKLKVDGVVGDETLHMINQGKRERFLQIVANLERLRWKPDATAERFVVVNVPSATLWAIEGGQVALEMPVVVGKPKRQTQIFITEIRGVRVNPDWTVPPTVKREDIVPAALEDPYYLRDKGIEIYDGYGPQAATIDPASIPWGELTDNDLHRLRMVQPPGDYNPLGRFRVIMPNEFNIYLHDTDEKDQFYSNVRALSSGCVRLSAPQKMANFILQGTKWGEERLQNIVVSGEKADLLIKDKLPVYIFYYTVWVDQNGQLIFGNDLYDRDKQLIQALSEIDGFVIPSQNAL